MSLAAQELYEKSLMRVEDNSLPADLLEIKTFLSVAQVNIIIHSHISACWQDDNYQLSDTLLMLSLHCAEWLLSLFSEFGEGHDNMSKAWFGKCLEE